MEDQRAELERRDEEVRAALHAAIDELPDLTFAAGYVGLERQGDDVWVGRVATSDRSVYEGFLVSLRPPQEASG